MGGYVIITQIVYRMRIRMSRVSLYTLVFCVISHKKMSGEQQQTLSIQN